jgi:hypothetical protein
MNKIHIQMYSHLLHKHQHNAQIMNPFLTDCSFNPAINKLRVGIVHQNKNKHHYHLNITCSFCSKHVNPILSLNHTTYLLNYFDRRSGNY